MSSARDAAARQNAARAARFGAALDEILRARALRAGRLLRAPDDPGAILDRCAPAGRAPTDLDPLNDAPD